MAPEKTQTLLELVDVHKSYGSVEVLHGVNLALGEGEVLGLIGENGAGKSTLLKVLNGIYPHGTYTGTLKLNGQEIKPVVIVKDSAGNKLVENTDYIVSCTKALIEAGTYDINVDFIGNYSGSKTLTLKIYSPTSKIKLNTTSVTMAIGQTANIEATVLPDTAKQGIKFSTSDKSIATVSS